MRIRMLTDVSGVGFTLSVGEETERFTDREAIRLIESGQAEPVAERKIENTDRPAQREKRATLKLPNMKA